MEAGSGSKSGGDGQVNAWDINDKAAERFWGSKDENHLAVIGKIVPSEIMNWQLADIMPKVSVLLNLYEATEAAQPDSTKTMDHSI